MASNEQHPKLGTLSDEEVKLVMWSRNLQQKKLGWNIALIEARNTISKLEPFTKEAVDAELERLRRNPSRTLEM